jgi:hypothetical protein
MTSPLALGLLTKTTLTFQVGDGTLVTDGLGNMTPNMQPLVVVAYLKNDGRPKHIFWPGADEDQLPLVGYFVEPQRVSVGLSSGAIAACVFQEQAGEFELSLPAPSIEIVRNLLGDKIYGLFRRR